jgi:hypothetical protein
VIGVGEQNLIAVLESAFLKTLHDLREEGIRDVGNN